MHKSTKTKSRARQADATLYLYTVIFNGVKNLAIYCAGSFATLRMTREIYHTLMGAPIGGLHSPQRHAISLATNILGGPGMNSWLNLALRERRGLVYTVEASTALLSDCGMMTIYFGCDHSDLRKCALIVEQTLNRLAEKQLTERALSAYKRQYLGQLTLGLDNKEQLALSTGRAILHGLQPPSAKVTEDIIRAISPSDFQDAAIVLAKAPLRTLTLA